MYKFREGMASLLLQSSPLCINLSSIFPGRGRSDIGLRSVTLEGLGVLRIGITVDIFHFGGIEYCYDLTNM